MNKIHALGANKTNPAQLYISELFFQLNICKLLILNTWTVH